MTDNKYHYTNVARLRDDVKDILDKTRFLGQRYIVTRHGNPMAQIIPPVAQQQTGADCITATDVRERTREVLDAVYHHNKTYAILRHGRTDAIICPV